MRFEARKPSHLTKIGGAELKVGGTVAPPIVYEIPPMM